MTRIEWLAAMKQAEGILGIEPLDWVPLDGLVMHLVRDGEEFQSYLVAAGLVRLVHIWKYDLFAYVSMWTE